MIQPRVADASDLGSLAGLKLGNYRLERLLGRGRMGAVYLAQDEALLRPTAIKLLAWSTPAAQGQDPVQWFLSEARLVARINHPRVVQIYGAARHGDRCYIAMEYVAGKSAEAVVAECGPMAPDVATDVLMQTASALQAAHRSGVIHRDVKPANLLIGSDGVAKLGDFGMALGLTDLRTGGAYLRVGTPFFTAPEIWRGGMASAASDLYSLGATYFQLLTGRPPFLGHDIAAIEQAHLRAPIPDPRDLVQGLPASCAALVMRALAKAPRERHASAGEMLCETRRVLQDLTAAARVGTSRAPRSERPQAQVRRAEPELSPRPLAGPLADVLGLARLPFSEVDPAACPYEGEPFDTVRSRVLESIEDEATTVVALVGDAGSGRTVLCRQVAAALTCARLVLRDDAASEAREESLLQRIGCAAGVDQDLGDDADLDALVARLSVEGRQQGAPPLIVLDRVDVQPSTRGLAALVDAARRSRSKVLVAGGPGLAAELTRAGVDLRGGRIPEIAIPPLDGRQTSRYVRRWLDVALPRAAAPIVASPDALSLVALRSRGSLALINRISANMLVLAAAEGRRVLSSWHAWTASDRERWPATRPLSPLPRRPHDWPPAEVVEAIDACRRDAGRPPWPRWLAHGKGSAGPEPGPLVNGCS